MPEQFINPVDDIFSKLPLIITPSKATLELECRFNVDERRKDQSRIKRYSPTQTIELAKNIISDSINKNLRCEVEQSINFIKSNNEIKQLYFVNGIQKKDKLTHYKKERIINPLIVLDEPSYKIALSFEHIIQPFSVQECQSARIKLRFSVYFDDWRLDITLLKPVSTLSNALVLKKSKNEMLFSITPDTFIKKAPWGISNYIEFEIEYVGDMEEITIESLQDAVGKFQNYINEMKFKALGNIKSNIENENNSDMSEEKRVSLHDSSHYQKKIYQIATFLKPRIAKKFIYKYGIKQLSNQVIEMDKNMFLGGVLPDIEKFYITDKIDGKRTILFITNGNVWGVSDKLNDLGEVKTINSTYIFDTEQYGNKYYIFDVMLWDGDVITEKTFEERMAYFSQATQLLNKKVDKKVNTKVDKKINTKVDKKINKKVHTNANIEVHTKPFTKLTSGFQAQIKKLKSTKKPYETDGFIFTPADGKYNDMNVYKYKPLDKLSVDFLIKKCPQKLLGINPYMPGGRTLYLLFCGISKNVFNKLNMELIDRYTDIFPHLNKYHLPNYFPIQFQPSNDKYAYLYWSDDDNLDNNIGEFSIPNYADPHTEYKWELLRLRDDRKIEVERGNYFGNNYKIAELTWMSYQNPLIIEELTKIELKSYFQKHESKLHDASRSYNSYVKTSIFNQYKNTESILDLASGKGQDLFRYARIGTKQIMFLEKDLTALSELIKRKHDYSIRRENGQMEIFAHQMDLNATYVDNIKILDAASLDIPNNGFDLIMCNFAFHYLIPNKKALVNIGKFINNYLKPGGRFIFTAFDGQSVFNLLKEHKGEWMSEKKDKFHIKKKYNQSTIQPTGQEIEVLLPFSSGEYYTEYLVNIDYIEAEFQKIGLVLETNQGFSQYLKNYKVSNKNSSKIMDEDDKLYTSLYHYYGFYKVKKGGRFRKYRF